MLNPSDFFKNRFNNASLRQAAVGFDLVELGVEVAGGSRFCICCRTFKGPGLRSRSASGICFCIGCWENRQIGQDCAHHTPPNDPRGSTLPPVA